MKAVLKNVMVATALAAAAVAAQAASAVLTNGSMQMGVSNSGGLGALGVGLTGPTGDAITPGCLCEGWGASGNGSIGTVYGLANSNIVSANLTTTTASGPGLLAQSVALLGNGLQVTHTYTAFDSNLFKVTIQLTNTTAAVMTDVRYARTLDWDVSPGFFGANYTTVYGGTPTGPGGKVLHTSTNPFGTPDPLTPRTQEANVNVTDSAGDKGGFFIFGFNNVNAGASVSFDTYIGAANSVSGLLKSLGAAGVEAYSYTTGNTPGTDGYAYAPAYGYGFVGLGLTPSLPGGTVPTPGSLALVGLGLVAAAAARRRKA